MENIKIGGKVEEKRTYERNDPLRDCSALPRYCNRRRRLPGQFLTSQFEHPEMAEDLGYSYLYKNYSRLRKTVNISLRLSK